MIGYLRAIEKGLVTDTRSHSSKSWARMAGEAARWSVDGAVAASSVSFEGLRVLIEDQMRWNQPMVAVNIKRSRCR